EAAMRALGLDPKRAARSKEEILSGRFVSLDALRAESNSSAALTGSAAPAAGTEARGCMSPDKAAYLEAHGWRLGTADEFLDRPAPSPAAGASGYQRRTSD